jgi:hypothetical protein
MASQFLRPRKRRTRQHVIADLSVHHVERFILEEGHTCQRLGSDYGYDLIVWTFDDQGYAEPGALYVQVKAAEHLHKSRTSYLFDLDVRDYNLWLREELPVILVLFDATRRRAYWLAVQEYFKAHPDRQPKHGAKRIRVRVPERQLVNRNAVAKMRLLKRTMIRQEQEELP